MEGSTRINKTSLREKRIDFLFNFIFIAPFCFLLAEMLFLSSNCASLVSSANPNYTQYVKGFFCYGYPQFLNHSPLFDDIFLRGALVKGAEHWSSALVLGLVPILIALITKNARFAFWSGIFYALQHELYWEILAITHNNNIGSSFDILYYLIVIIVVSAFVFRRYKEVYWNLEFFALVISPYIAFLSVWEYFGFHLTVIGGLASPILTQWYFDFQTNFFEVGSWQWLGLLFVIFIWYINRKVNIRKLYQ